MLLSQFGHAGGKAMQHVRHQPLLADDMFQTSLMESIRTVSNECGSKSSGSPCCKLAFGAQSFCRQFNFQVGNAAGRNLDL